MNSVQNKFRQHADISIEDDPLGIEGEIWDNVTMSFYELVIGSQVWKCDFFSEGI